jgi:ferredoxin
MEDTMRVEVDWDRCEGHGMCAEAASELFRLDDEGDLQVLDEDVPEELVRRAEAAVRRCPVAALRLAR